MGDKVFNVFGLGLLSGLSLLNFNAGYQIHQGKNLNVDLNSEVQLRPSYVERVSEAMKFYKMTDEQKLEFINQKIKLEEDKFAVQKSIEAHQGESKAESAPAL